MQPLVDFVFSIILMLDRSAIKEYWIISTILKLLGLD